MSDDRIVILAHEKFPDRAKTALGVMRYGDQDVRAVLDRDRAGDRVHDHVPDVADAPIVESFADAYAAADGDVDALYIGIAPIGGGFDESWRSDVEAAIEAGCDVVSGLHYFLNGDEELVALADEHGVDLVDVREPDDDLTVATGASGDVDADVVLTVGTDCSVGKMTASLEIVAAARERGIDAAFVPTGQTGIMIAGWGTRSTASSPTSPPARLRTCSSRSATTTTSLVEGQGSIIHPAYSAVTCGILHGSMADGLVLCHAAGREAVHGYESFSLPPLADYVDLYEGLAAPVNEASIVAGALNTKDVDDDAAAAEAVTDFGDEAGVPAADPVRDGAGRIVDGIVEAGLGEGTAAADGGVADE